jgi:hypothetical protein
LEESEISSKRVWSEKAMNSEISMQKVISDFWANYLYSEKTEISSKRVRSEKAENSYISMQKVISDFWAN